MALRTPLYLDTDTLLAQADYHEIEVPQREEIVEKTLKRRSGGGKFGIGPAGLDAAGGSEVERQSTYNLEPNMKATISKVIDGLIAEGAVKRPVVSDPAALARDDLVELEGLTRITSASHFGKMFFILRRVFEGANLEDLEDLATTFTESDLQDEMAQVYLRNELLPIPVLLELEGSALPHRVYVNVDPNHFVDSASADHVEGDLRVLGTVSRLIDGSPDGYFSAEQWLMSGWETFLRRTFMMQMDDALDTLREAWAAAGVTLPREDVNAYISGPAIVVNAIALY